MDSSAQPNESELRRLFALAWPLTWAYLGNQMLTLVGISVVGRLGEIPLAGVGLGNSVYYGAITLGMGTMIGLDPLVSQAVGAREPATARRLLWQSLWLAGLLTVPITVLVILGRSLLLRSTMDAAMLAEMSKYILARLPGVFPFLCLIGSRSYLQSHAATRPYFVGVVLANIVNLPLSAFLVLEHVDFAGFHAPGLGLGVVGAGLATTTCTMLQAGILVASAITLGEEHEVSRSADPALLRSAIRLGVPIGVTMFAEISVFALTAMLAGWLGPQSIAAHQVAITLASTTFQVAVAIGSAASVRVGLAVGRGDSAAARRAGLIALAFGCGAMTCTAAAFLVAPHGLARLVSTDGRVISASIALIFIAAVFQIFDGAQAVMAGNLRGAGDTRFPMIANIVGHYAVGLPTSLGLAFGLHWGARGLWWGLCAGLMAVSIALTARFLRISRRPIARAMIAR